MASTQNNAPGVFVKLNWNRPLLNPALVSVVVVATGTLMFTMADVLWMPFTKTVAKAQPGGKFQTIADVGEQVDQFSFYGKEPLNLRFTINDLEDKVFARFALFCGPQICVPPRPLRSDDQEITGQTPHAVPN